MHRCSRVSLPTPRKTRALKYKPWGQISSEEECQGQRASLYELHILLQESTVQQPKRVIFLHFLHFCEYLLKLNQFEYSTGRVQVDLLKVQRASITSEVTDQCSHKHTWQHWSHSYHSRVTQIILCCRSHCTTCQSQESRSLCSFVPDFSKLNYSDLCNHLFTVDFSDCLLSTDTEYIWCRLRSILLEAIDFTLPRSR